jgi:hypothetical protein
LIRYGDITPITPTGRIISCLCALSGSATIGMLVSVLVDRYQRVYARKLYIYKPEIDFEDYSDDENNDTTSHDLSHFNAHGENSPIVDPDARAKQNLQFENNRKKHSETSTSQLEEEEEPAQSNSNRIHFSIGSVVDEKQTSGENISLKVMSNEQSQPSSSLNVKFELASSSDDEYANLTAIKNDDRRKGNVLKTFQRPLSLDDIRLNNSD